MKQDRRRPKEASGSRIHRGLVGTRTLIGTRYLENPELRSEYARDIAPRTALALHKILGEAFPDPGGSSDPRGGTRPRRVLDLGAGTGAAGAAVRAYFENDLELTAVDHVSAGAAVRIADVTDTAALTRAVGAGTPFDLLLAAHVLNELYVDQAPEARVARLAALVGRWCQLLLAEHGTAILIEPALRETSRILLGVRDRVLAAGLQVVAPCFFTGPCPALLRERDWCHDSTPAEPNDDRHRVDFSYLVIRASGEPTRDPSLFRIVSDPLPEKGRLKLFACGLSGRQPFARLDRHATPTNADLDRLVRGDVARIARTTFAQDGLRIVADTAVNKQESRHAGNIGQKVGSREGQPSHERRRRG